VNRIFFFHVGKVGGTSLVSVLQSLYDPAEICPRPEKRVWDAEFAAEARRYKLITGHFDVDFMREVGEPGITLCMLRNPYERIRSLYDFWRSFTWRSIDEGLPPINGQRFAKLVTFHEFVLAGNAFIRKRVWNAATRQLLGKRYQALEKNQERAALEAFEVLKSLHWFGISEFSDESLRRLAPILKISAPRDMPRLNQTYENVRHGVLEREKVIRTVPLREECQLIATTNRADILLYGRALSLFLSEADGRTFSCHPWVDDDLGVWPFGADNLTSSPETHAEFPPPSQIRATVPTSAMMLSTRPTTTLTGR
jgi:hypothetical protein